MEEINKNKFTNLENELNIYKIKIKNNNLNTLNRKPIKILINSKNIYISPYYDYNDIKFKKYYLHTEFKRIYKLLKIKKF